MYCTNIQPETAKTEIRGISWCISNHLFPMTEVEGHILEQYATY